MSGSVVKRAIYVILIIFVLLQFFTPKRTNPPVTQEISAPPEVMSILQKSCYDCHSNKTRWPWYSKVAPISFLVVRDVNEGRKHMNFTEWDKIPQQKLAKVFEEIAEEVQEGEMPMPIYLIMHSDARLSPSEKNTLVTWAQQKSGKGEGSESQGASGEEEHEEDDD